MRVLITGSNGQIGTNLGLCLQSQGHVVVHLAAHAKVHELVMNPDRTIENISMVHNFTQIQPPVLF